MTSNPRSVASLDVAKGENGTILRFRGRLDSEGAAGLWTPAREAASAGGAVEADCSEVEYLDGAGVGLLLDLRRAARGRLRVAGLRKEFQALLEPFADQSLPESFAPPPRSDPLPVYIGKLAADLASDLRQQIVFAGRLLVLLLSLARNPSLLRWRDTWTTFQKVGNNAFVIVCLIGFLMGMIMGFQSAVPLRQFGVDLFVVNLVAIAMLRELGAIMTAIVVAGRSGSAFAAEIGTMKINEEIDALTTMGIDPGRFLVLPRVLAGTMATPLLTVYANAIGILGGLFVVSTFGHSWPAIWTQLGGAVSAPDVMTGMIKSVVFGFLISAIGCLRGLQTQTGALAVGASTTRAVVSSILLIILADGIFAVVFYSIGF